MAKTGQLTSSSGNLGSRSHRRVSWLRTSPDWIGKCGLPRSVGTQIIPGSVVFCWRSLKGPRLYLACSDTIRSGNSHHAIFEPCCTTIVLRVLQSVGLPAPGGNVNGAVIIPRCSTFLESKLSLAD